MEHETIAEVGRVALLYNNFILAKDCADRYLPSLPPSPSRIYTFLHLPSSSSLIFAGYLNLST